MSQFKDLPINPDIQRALDELGFTEPTEIQKKAIPLLALSKKIDFHGQAQTGTGKTLAFGLPLLQKIDLSKKVPQALVVAPTRELAVQIGDSLQKAAKYLQLKIVTIYGGVSMEEQIRQLKGGCQIVIGTPGRLNDHLRRKTLNLSSLYTLVLDEADIMLDMGFKDEIEEIFAFIPADREIWLFSATVKPGIKDLMDKYMKEPVSVRISKQQIASSNTKQYFCVVTFRHRLHALARFIESTPDFYGFIFCQTKILTGEIAEQLLKRGYNVGALHGDLSQAQRNNVIKKFKNKDISIVVATDVAARGIDVSDLTHVVNYSIPEDLESYVHRIGRTGRAGKQGVAITFINKTDLRDIKTLEKKFHVAIEPIDIPTVEQILEVRLKQAQAFIENPEIKKSSTHNEKIMKFIDNLTAAQIKESFANLLYDKFLKYVDTEEIPYTHVDKSQDFSSEQQFQEVYLNVGSDDGVTQADVKEFIQSSVSEHQIISVRVIKRRSFVKLSGDCSLDLINSLKGKTLGGRKIFVNLTCLVEDGKSRGNRFRRDGGRSSFRDRGPRRDGEGSGFSRDRDRGPRRDSESSGFGRDRGPRGDFRGSGRRSDRDGFSRKKSYSND